MKSYGWLLLALAPVAAAQDKSAPAPAQVVVNGEAERDFVAGKLVIGKKAIAESGAQNAGEVLRREPAVTVGKNGQLSLMGLPGYTQILVDGQPPTAADPMQLDALQIERIEIIKSATAETGPFGLAGTINIVRRKVERKAMTQVRANGNMAGGQGGGGVTLTSNQLPDASPWSYNYALVADRRNTPGLRQYRQEQTIGGQQVVLYQGEDSSSGRLDMFTGDFNAEVKLTLAHKLRFSAEAGRIVESSGATDQRTWPDARRLAVDKQSRTPMTTRSAAVTWSWNIDDESRFELMLRSIATNLDNDYQRFEQWAPGQPRTRFDAWQKDSRNNILDLKYNTELGAGHEISAGAKFSRNSDDTNYLNLVNGLPDLSFGVLGNKVAGRSTTTRFFVQDDWRLDRANALGFGLSTEEHELDLREGPYENRSTYRIWSPTLHFAHKIGGDRKRQLRASLARTFQAPGDYQLMLRPYINYLAPCNAAGQCGANTPDTNDKSGNPKLQPERALGLNLRYSHGFGSGSEFATELYSRRIDNKIGTMLALESVAWANVPRYVSRPANLGEADIYGISFEGRSSAKDFWKDAPALDLNGSVGFSRSHLRDLPGSDNRIPGQLPWRAKLGLSYSVPGMPLKLNADANWLPSDWTRQNLVERAYQSSRFTLNTSAAWKVNPKTRLVFSIDNLVKRKGRQIDEYSAQGLTLTGYSERDSNTRLRVSLDTTLGD
ncbi:outer membrane beta-barrel protein [Pseudoduganella sp. DS3]|uniref:Outer membrane beta-barrel protein n=1 Tax=Pseudoduganella guangdongensis TaxID=2692179 RepID=A0A6N9HCZ0_9BURK|nr:TonB-dependent receptor [Pseudoduganella guangdongensis]MYN00893.1 outer membrane beta-barrel protein [Pseudoduganella guangdongensis]